MRIRALSACQDVLVHSGWQNVPIEALVRAQLGHFDDLVGRRIGISGHAIKINAAARTSTETAPGGQKRNEPQPGRQNARTPPSAYHIWQ